MLKRWADEFSRRFFYDDETDALLLAQGFTEGFRAAREMAAGVAFREANAGADPGTIIRAIHAIGEEELKVP